MLEENSTVTTRITASEDTKRTFEVQKVWEDAEGRSAIVIELYPTLHISEGNRMDLSMMHLLNHVEELGWKDVRILNLFSTVFDRKPLAKQLKMDEENLAYFQKVLEQPDIKESDIVVAWGTTLENNQNAREMKKKFLSLLVQKGLGGQVKQFSVDTLETLQQISPHPLYLGLRHAREEWKLENFPLSKVLKELEPKVKQTERAKTGQNKSEEISVKADTAEKPEEKQTVPAEVKKAKKS